MDLMNKILTTVFLIIAFFTFALFGAGSHGHMGLWDHGNSFDMYLIIYYCLTAVAILNYFNYKDGRQQSDSNKYFILVLILVVLLSGLLMMIFTVIEDLESAPDRVVIFDYIKIFIPVGLLTYWLMEFIRRKNKYMP